MEVPTFLARLFMTVQSVCCVFVLAQRNSLKASFIYILLMSTVFIMMMSCCEAQPIELEHEQRQAANVDKTLQKSMRKRRSISVPGHLFLKNICQEEVITIDLQKHFKTTDTFYPATIKAVRCAKSRTVQSRVYQTCGTSPLAICKTKWRKVYFTRQPNNGDCRHVTQRQMRVAVSCECRQSSFSIG